MDTGLKRELEAKIFAGERLTREDGVALYESDDLAWLGRLAHRQRTEISGDRVTFAVNPRSNLDDAPSLVGFTAEEAGELLDELTAAGLGSLTGGEGDQWDDWSRVHRLAHERGLKTSATMLYGHDEELADRVDHLVRLRTLQDETGGFTTFVPLRHRPASADAAPAAPAESRKTFAVSRLMLDNVAHVRSSWQSHGAPVTQLALNFGADDIEAPGDVDREDLLTLIWDAGFRPVERDFLYAVIHEYDAAPSFTDRRSQPQQVWA